MTDLLMLLSAVLVGFACGGLAWVVLSIATVPRVVDPALGRFEVERRQELRQASWTYRTFEPWIDELRNNSALIGGGGKSEKTVEKALKGSGIGIPWQTTEYLATVRVEAILAAAACGMLGWLMGGSGAALFLAVLAYLFYPSIRIRKLRKTVQLRLTAIRRRFAAIVDLMALMMEVGASFQDSLAAVARETRGHPLGEEIDRVLQDIQLGRPRSDCLKAFSDRVGDDDIDELTSAVIEGETLGTPLAEIMRTQADQIRQKRSQWAEKAAEEAQVAIVFPAMVIMIACLLIVVAPFILGALYMYG